MDDKVFWKTDNMLYVDYIDPETPINVSPAWPDAVVAKNVVVTKSVPQATPTPLPDWMATDHTGLGLYPSLQLRIMLARFGRSHQQTCEWAWSELALWTFFPAFPGESSASILKINKPGIASSVDLGNWNYLKKFLALRGCYFDPAAISEPSDDWLCAKCSPEGGASPKKAGKKHMIDKGRQVVLVAQKDSQLIVPEGFRTIIV